MVVWVILAIIVAALLLAALAAWFARRGTVPPPVAPTVATTEEDPAARQMRQQSAEAKGSELLERRVDLDAKRGTLGGDVGLYDALDRLEQRRQRGEISEQAFEDEKVRLLSGLGG